MRTRSRQSHIELSVHNSLF